MSKKMPDWAYNQMIEGLQKLLVLRLPGAPPADTIKALAMVWEEALTPHCWPFELELDGERLPRAFTQLLQDAKQWVNPAMLIERLPPRAPPLLIAHTPQPPTQEELEKNRKIAQEILNSFRNT